MLTLSNINSQSALKKRLQLDGTSSGVVLLDGKRIGCYRMEKGHGGHAVLVASLAKEFGSNVTAGRKETLHAAIAKQLYHRSQQTEGV